MDPARSRLVLRGHLHPLDWTLIVLACASVLLFLAHRLGSLAGLDQGMVRTVDYVMSGAYAVVFVAKWIMAREHTVWLRRHIALAPGILPLTVSILPDPWFFIGQLSVLGMRGGKALDRAFGQHVAAALSERYKSMIVEELTEPLLMRLAVLLEDSVTSRDYAAAIGKRLDERRDLVEAAVARAISASPKLSRVTRFGPVHRFVDETTKEVVDAAHAALTGPEINTLIREAFHDAFAELKSGIEERKWRRKGVGLSDVAHGISASLHHRPEAPAAPAPVRVRAVEAAPVLQKL